MQKRITSQPTTEASRPEGGWLDLDAVADVEVTSEDAAHPVESALLPNGGAGWRAGTTGSQTLRLIFHPPQRLSRIRLRFREEKCERGQEFVLRWTGAGHRDAQIVRQQYHFSPPGTVEELEEYRVNLEEVSTLELTITPDISGGGARASLAEMRLA
ncbi:MAG TPA: hypothetical protein VF614_14385 [Chthoniobacteraceae bacterium]